MRFGWILLGLVVVLWGVAPVSIGVAVGPHGGFGPLWLNASRLVVAGVVLLVVTRLRGRVVFAVRDVLPLLLLGLVGWSLGSGLQVIAQQDVASGLAALVLSLGPALTLVVDAGTERRLPAPIHAFGVLLGLIGVGLIVAGGGLGSGSVLSVLLLLGATAGWAAAAVFQSRRPSSVAPGASAGWQMLFGGAGLALAALTFGEPLPVPTVAGWASWVYLAVGAGLVGFLCWVEVLRRLPVVAAMSQPTLSTLVAVLAGHVFLAEDLGEAAPLGIALALVGAGATLLPRDAVRRAIRSASRVPLPRPRTGALPVVARARPVAPRPARLPRRHDL